MKNTMNTTKKEVKVGLIGVGLNTYWNQFEGLLSRLTVSYTHLRAHETL